MEMSGVLGIHTWVKKGMSSTDIHPSAGQPLSNYRMLVQYEGVFAIYRADLSKPRPTRERLQVGEQGRRR